MMILVTTTLIYHLSLFPAFMLFATSEGEVETVLKYVGVVIGLFIGWGVIRFAQRSGEIVAGIEALRGEVNTNTDVLSSFAVEVRGKLENHGERIARVEERWNGEERRRHPRRPEN